MLHAVPLEPNREPESEKITLHVREEGANGARSYTLESLESGGTLYRPLIGFNYWVYVAFPEEFERLVARTRHEGKVFLVSSQITQTGTSLMWRIKANVPMASSGANGFELVKRSFSLFFAKE